MIDPDARVDPKAELGSNVSVGAWTTIGPEVRIGDNTWIGPHVMINGATTIGANNKIYQFNSIGEVPQDKKFRGEPTRLAIGDNNVVREFCTLNRGTQGGGGVTRIGNDNWIMAYVHVAHDCEVGNNVVMANGATLAGHVIVGDWVTFGAFTVVHQFCAVGAHSFSAMGTVILKDVPPFVTVSGNSAEVRGLNSEGLRRRGFSSDAIRGLKQAYKTIFRKGLSVAEALVELEALSHACEEVGEFSAFLKSSSRGIVR